MTHAEALTALQSIDPSDVDSHVEAADILAALLKTLGYIDIVDAYDRIPTAYT